MTMLMQEEGEIGQRLQMVVNCLGNTTLAQHLGVDEESLARLLSGEEEMSAEIGEKLAGLMMGVEAAVTRLPFDGEGVGDLVLSGDTPVGGVVEALEPVGLDLDGDGEADMTVPNLGIVQGGKPSFGDETERRRQNLRSARITALMTQFRDDMEHAELVAALGMVAQIELALIMAFRESLPEPGQDWDGERRAREIDKRLARLRWVKRENDRMFSGVRGVFKRMGGQRPVSGRELYEKMVRETDLILDVMENRVAGRNMDLVLKRAGLGYLVED